MEIKTILDAAIIGMGPAGISAAIYLKRGGIDPVCFEAKKIGGKINQIKEIENYPSFLGNGEELAKKLAEQMAYFKIGIKEEMVTNIYKLDDGTFQVKTRNADYLFRSVILASGIRERPFALKGSDLYQNNGISRCAECDGPFYKKKPVAVLGDSLAAIKDAGYLAGLCSKVYFISEGDKINVSTEELKEFTDLKNTELILSSSVLDSFGTQHLQKLVIGDKKDLSHTKTLDVDALFLFIGATPLTEFLGYMDVADENGFIKTDNKMQTSVKGLFACGDARLSPLKQVVTAVGEGGIAGVSCRSYINEIKKQK